MRGFIASLPWLPLLSLAVACAPPDDETSDARDGLADADALAEADAQIDTAPEAEADAAEETDAEPDSDGSAEVDAEADATPDVPPTCGFGYETEFHSWTPPAGAQAAPRAQLPASASTSPPAAPRDENPFVRFAPPPQDIAGIAHIEPLPPDLERLARPDPWGGPWFDIVMPGYADTMPLFGRAQAWSEPTRCYETPTGVRLLSESDAWDIYRRIAETTTGVPFVASPGVRSVVGLRGAYPGTFSWHGNAPNRFNDTLALLWVDPDGARHVREFPVNTDTGAYDFGVDSSSSLRANRRYHHVNGWHRTYNALHIDEDGYRVRDDTNNNGHWDSDRNGWLPPLSEPDYDRNGGGHNIHMGSVDAPLGTAPVDVWSAGCQVIPGMANWTEFINNAWTVEGDPVDYFLIDTRDIPPEVWSGPCTPDGTRACPFPIPSLPFAASGDTTAAPSDEFDLYNCSTADESGPEVFYVFTTDVSGTLSVSVDALAPIDPDVHLLEGADPNACLARAHISFDYPLTPGRYFIVVDTFVDGTPLSGPYTLHVDLR
ncbi:MAG: hypothetical protein HY907_16610 [Deltaproteobacteria bacterium]|nr:hypothetical protein [Deltaproteobacteria bacterium]